MKTKIIALIFSIAILTFVTDRDLEAQVTQIRESKTSLKTYPFFDPDPVAGMGIIYPYYRFDGYSHDGEPREWQMVTLENEYIKVFITPEIGGKIWGALDKTTGKMFIYYNQVVKFRDIAMRGPWTSGGIESNFGTIGHAPTCSSPVDYILCENSDSSASCIIGATDLPSGTTWRVEIRLPKDKAFFETNVLWHNGSDLHQSYYHWMNSAARAADDLFLFFPGHSFIGHDGLAHSWPENQENRNLAYYVNNNFGSYKSYHVLGQYSGLFGGYYYDDQSGFGNWSLYTDKPGKKLWIWGLSRQGMIWENLLTDSDGQYIEWQSGRLFNQAAAASSLTPFKQREFLPGTTDIWREIWFPVNNTNGMSAASSYGTLNANRQKNQINFYLCPLQQINDEFIVSANGRKIYSKQLNLKPLQNFSDSVRYEGDAGITISLGGKKLAYETGGEETELKRPLESPENFDWNSVQGLAINAREELRQRHFDKAIGLYTTCLASDPYYRDALVAMAELHFRRMDYDSAQTYARRALAIDTYDGAANFIYGLINRRIEKRADAAEGFSLAAHSMNYRSAAYAQLAELALKANNWEEAEIYSRRALDFNRYNLTACQALIISLRRRGDMQRTVSAIQEMLDIDALNHFARFEHYLLTGDQKQLHEFQVRIRGEFPQETFLELAVIYYRLGMMDDARRLLTYAPVHPIISYWRAYLADQTGEKERGRDFLRKATIQSPYLVFPFRTETAEILEWVKGESNDWKIMYYLALIYWHHGKINEAGALLTACRELPDFAPFYLMRAKYNKDIDPAASASDCQKAIRLDNRGWRAWVFLSEVYEKMGEQEKSVDALGQIYQKNPDDYRLAIPYARALFRGEAFDEALKVLEKTTVLPFEGAGGAYRIYHQAHLNLALSDIENENFLSALIHVDKARLWPENLGAGKPYDLDERLEDYLTMVIHDLLNQTDKAKRYFASISMKTEKYRNNAGINQLISILAFERQGKHNEAVTLLEEWSRASNDTELAFWAVALFNGKSEEEKRFFNKIKDRPEIQIYLKTVRLTLSN